MTYAWFKLFRGKDGPVVTLVWGGTEYRPVTEMAYAIHNKQYIDFQINQTTINLLNNRLREVVEPLVARGVLPAGITIGEPPMNEETKQTLDNFMDEPNRQEFKFGDLVEKVGGDYTYVGEVRGVIEKKSGVFRYAVEDDRGMLHIFAGKQLKLNPPEHSVL